MMKQNAGCEEPCRNFAVSVMGWKPWPWSGLSVMDSIGKDAAKIGRTINKEIKRSRGTWQ
jgi:hypothetical protein